MNPVTISGGVALAKKDAATSSQAHPIVALASSQLVPKAPGASHLPADLKVTVESPKKAIPDVGNIKKVITTIRMAGPSSDQFEMMMRVTKLSDAVGNLPMVTEEVLPYIGVWEEVIELYQSLGAQDQVDSTVSVLVYGLLDLSAKEDMVDPLLRLLRFLPQIDDTCKDVWFKLKSYFSKIKPDTRSEMALTELTAKCPKLESFTNDVDRSPDRIKRIVESIRSSRDHKLVIELFDNLKLVPLFPMEPWLMSFECLENVVKDKDILRRAKTLFVDRTIAHQLGMMTSVEHETLAVQLRRVAIVLPSVGEGVIQYQPLWIKLLEHYAKLSTTRHDELVCKLLLATIGYETIVIKGCPATHIRPLFTRIPKVYDIKNRFWQRLNSHCRFFGRIDVSLMSDFEKAHPDLVKMFEVETGATAKVTAASMDRKDHKFLVRERAQSFDPHEEKKKQS